MLRRRRWNFNPSPTSDDGTRRRRQADKGENLICCLSGKESCFWWRRTVTGDLNSPHCTSAGCSQLLREKKTTRKKKRKENFFRHFFFLFRFFFFFFFCQKPLKPKLPDKLFERRRHTGRKKKKSLKFPTRVLRRSGGGKEALKVHSRLWAGK